MRLCLFALTAALVSLCLPVLGTTLHYRDTAAGQFVRLHLPDADPGLVTSMNERSDSMVYSLDSNCFTKAWQFTNEKTNTMISTSRSNKTITALGIFKGKKFYKTYRIDDDPWLQEWSLPVEVFARSGTKSIQFWSIDPANMQRIMKLELTNLDPDTIEFHGSMTPVYHVRVSLTGLAAALGKGDYWVRKSDDRAVRSRMPRGIGKKPTVSELEK